MNPRESVIYQLVAGTIFTKVYLIQCSTYSLWKIPVFVSTHNTDILILRRDHSTNHQYDQSTG